MKFGTCIKHRVAKMLEVISRSSEVIKSQIPESARSYRDVSDRACLQYTKPTQDPLGRIQVYVRLGVLA